MNTSALLTVEGQDVPSNTVEERSCDERWMQAKQWEQPEQKFRNCWAWTFITI